METPSFYCPYTGDMYSSKSYTAYRLKAAVPYHSFLNISPPKRSKKSVSIILDNDVVPTIILKEPEEYKLDIDRFITVNCKPSGSVSEDGIERIDTSKAGQSEAQNQKQRQYLRRGSQLLQWTVQVEF